MAKIKVSQMTAATDIDAGDLVYLSVEDLTSASGYSSRKDTAGNLAAAFLNGFEFPLLLNTSAKTIVGAINELAAGASAAVYMGTTPPSSATGENGNLYVQYHVENNASVVDALFVKISGAWCQISTGGGSAGTHLTATLAAGETSVTFSDASITATCNIEIFSSMVGLMPTASVAAVGSLTLTYPAQQTAVDLEAVIYGGNV